MSSPPGVLVTPSDQQAVFWKTSVGNLAEIWWTPVDRAWHGPVNVTSGAPMVSGPSAAITPTGQQLVFWEGPGGSLQESWWTPGFGWSGVAWYGFASLYSTPSVDVDATGRQTVFWKGADANAWMAQWSSGKWAAPTDLKLGPIQ
jgi:hypothetical protein